MTASVGALSQTITLTPQVSNHGSSAAGANSTNSNSATTSADSFGVSTSSSAYQNIDWVVTVIVHTGDDSIAPHVTEGSANFTLTDYAMSYAQQYLVGGSATGQAAADSITAYSSVSYGYDYDIENGDDLYVSSSLVGISFLSQGMGYWRATKTIATSSLSASSSLSHPNANPTDDDGYGQAKVISNNFHASAVTSL